ncbi:MAG: hypothetical protein ACTTGJ_01885 [Clostridium sp.]
MKKCNKKQNNNKNNGITLIALVLTIIVLLILAGVALSLALGQNGLIFKSRESQQEQEIAQEKDRIMTAYGASFAKDKGKFEKGTFEQELRKSGVNFDKDKLKTISDNPLKIELVTNHTGYTVEYEIDKGILKRKSIGQNHSAELGIQVGDIITYDPTKGVTDQSKLTYKSQLGTPSTGGNGYGEQTVKAKENQNEWIVLSTANNQIKVMIKEPIGEVSGGNNNQFSFKGGIGWLYAEEELHKACSVYGHGKGTIKTNTTYKVGNEETGEAQSRTLTGSGARSMTMEDIVKIMKGEEHTDFTDEEKKGFYSEYMDPAKKSREVFYPTVSSTELVGSSRIKKIFDNKWYHIDLANYDKELVTDSKIKQNKEKLKNHIYNMYNYYISSRTPLNYNTGDVYFYIRAVNSSYINGNMVYIGDYGSDSPIASANALLRPVVYLNPSMLEKTGEGKWKIKD